jgi:hypothetical protein
VLSDFVLHKRSPEGLSHISPKALEHGMKSCWFMAADRTAHEKRLDDFENLNRRVPSSRPQTGGVCDADVTKRTNYLIIGTFGTRDWLHTSFGRKIEKAVSLRESGLRIAIAAEDHWPKMVEGAV